MLKRKHNSALKASKKRSSTFYCNEASLLGSRELQLDEPFIRCLKDRGNVSCPPTLFVFLKKRLQSRQSGWCLHGPRPALQCFSFPSKQRSLGAQIRICSSNADSEQSSVCELAKRWSVCGSPVWSWPVSCVVFQMVGWQWVPLRVECYLAICLRKYFLSHRHRDGSS